MMWEKRDLPLISISRGNREMCPHQVFIIWEENKREAKMYWGSSGLCFLYCHQLGVNQVLVLAAAWWGLWSLPGAGELSSCFNVWSTWYLVSCGALVTVPWPVLRALCSGFILSPLSCQACLASISLPWHGHLSSVRVSES